MAFKKGESGNPKGRDKGSKNKHTKAVKEVFLNVFHKLEGSNDQKQGLYAFAKESPKDFYKIASKLIPQEIAGELTGEVIIRVVRD